MTDNQNGLSLPESDTTTGTSTSTSSLTGEEDSAPETLDSSTSRTMGRPTTRSSSQQGTSGRLCTTFTRRTSSPASSDRFPTLTRQNQTLGPTPFDGFYQQPRPPMNFCPGCGRPIQFTTWRRYSNGSGSRRGSSSTPYQRTPSSNDRSTTSQGKSKSGWTQSLRKR